MSIAITDFKEVTGSKMAAGNRMETTVETMNPARAKMLLDRNKDNRSVKWHKVHQYAEDLRNGNWSFTGESISFFENGLIANGQHRLLACVESGMPFQTVIVYGVPVESKPNIDTGTARSAGDVLGMSSDVGNQDAHAVSGAAKTIILHDAGVSYGNSNTTSKRNLITNKAVQDFYINNQRKVNASLNWVRDNVKKTGAVLPRRHQIALHFLFSRHHPVAAEFFLTQVLCGVGIHSGTTPSHVRDILVSAISGGNRLPERDRVYLTIKAFNSYASGRNIKHSGNVRIRKSEPTPFVKSN